MRTGGPGSGASAARTRIATAQAPTRARQARRPPVQLSRNTLVWQLILPVLGQPPWEAKATLYPALPQQPSHAKQS